MPEGSRHVRAFLRDQIRHVLPLARELGIADRVVVHPHLPRAQAAAIQQQADVLLLMQWDDPREQGNLPGKLFEYLGARRPILGLGLEDGVPAEIIRERAAGCFSNDPAEIALQLSAWLDTKRRLVPAGPARAAAGFTRAEQFAAGAALRRNGARVGQMMLIVVCRRRETIQRSNRSSCSPASRAAAADRPGSSAVAADRPQPSAWINGQGIRSIPRIEIRCPYRLTMSASWRNQRTSGSRNWARCRCTLSQTSSCR